MYRVASRQMPQHAIRLAAIQDTIVRTFRAGEAGGKLCRANVATLCVSRTGCGLLTSAFPKDRRI